MSWEKYIPGCFSPLDKRFLSHPTEELRSKEFFKELVTQRVTWEQLVRAVRIWLESDQKLTPEHINEELGKVGKWFANKQRRPRIKNREGN